MVHESRRRPLASSRGDRARPRGGRAAGDANVSNVGTIHGLIAGTALGWTGRVLVGRIGDTTAMPGRDAAIAAAVLFSISAGMSVPGGLSWWIFRGRHRANSGVTQYGTDAPVGWDASLLRTVSAIAFLATGLIVAGAALSLEAGDRVHAFLSTRFFATNGLHGAMDFARGLIACAVPLGALGCTVACVLYQGRPDGRWSPVSLAWILVGVGTGIGLSDAVSASGISTVVMLLGASVPLLGMAMLGARGDVPVPERDLQATRPPAAADGDDPTAAAPWSVRGIVDLAGAIALFWWMSHGFGPTGAPHAADFTPLMFLVAAAGAVAGAARVRSHRPDRMAPLLAIVLAGAVNIVFMVLSDQAIQAGVVSAGRVLIVLPCAAVYLIVESAARYVVDAASPFGVRTAEMVSMLAQALRVWTVASLIYGAFGWQLCDPRNCVVILAMAFALIGVVVLLIGRHAADPSSART